MNVVIQSIDNLDKRHQKLDADLNKRTNHEFRKSYEDI